jgi:hypothetical protein
VTRNARFSLAVLALVSLPCARAAVSPDIRTIIANSVAANNADWEAAPGFDFTERDKTNTGTRTSHVMMIFGSPYYRLVALNGKPLPPAAEETEQRRLDNAIELRRAESPQRRSERIARYESERRRDHVLMSQLTVAFDFTLNPEQRMGPYAVYALGATPRAGYQPPDMECQALAGMEGTLWIDKASFQWVKVEAHVIPPVSIEGFLAQVEPGTQFELDLAPVADNIWLPSRFAMKSRAKVLHLFNHRTQQNETYSNYRRATPASGAASRIFADALRRRVTATR